MYRITCCGKFHYNKYIRFLEGAGVELVFSHKLSTLKGLSNVRNLFLKEYTFYLARAILPSSKYLWAYHIGHFFWRLQLPGVLRRPVKVDNFLCHGNCGQVVGNSRYKSVKVATVVNAHPVVQEHLLDIAKSGLPKNVIEADTSNVYFERYADRIVSEARAADYLLCPSSFVAKTFEEQGFARSRIKVINYGLDAPLKTDSISRGAREGATALKVICVGQIMPRKGQHLLVEACKRLSERGCPVQLTLVGASLGGYRAYLETLDFPFEYIAHLEHSALLERLQQADLFVLPSYEDGFAVVVAEAISVGLPVIISSATGAADLLVGKSDSIFRVGDGDDLFRKMEKFVREGYSETFSAYTWDVYARKIHQFFSEISE